MFRAVRGDDARTVATLLNRGLDPNSTDKHGNTILMLAARLGYRDIGAMLLARHASVGRRNPYGDTALMFACVAGHLDLVKLLVQHGARINRPGWTPLGYAAFNGNPAVVQYLLAKGADINALQPNGYTPLMLAVRNDNAAAARALLHADADVGPRAPNGETALSIAKERSDRGLVDLLERVGAGR